MAKLSRRKVFALGAGLSLTGFAGCSNTDDGHASGDTASSTKGASGTIRFMFWGSGDRVKRFKKATEAFNKANPDITVKPEYAAIDSVETKIKVGMSGGDLPDVFWLTTDWLPKLAEDNHLMDLGQYLGEDDGIADKGFTEDVLEPGKHDDKQVALTHSFQSIGMFAKEQTLKDLDVPIKQYPEAYTWDEYREYCLKIHKDKGAKFWGTDNPTVTGAGGFLRAYARQHGQHEWTNDGDLGYTKELFKDWLKYWDKLRKDRGAAPTDRSLEQNPYFEGSTLIRGLSAFHMRNSNQLLELQSLTKDKLVLMPAPGNGGDAGNKNIALDPNLLGVAAKTKHPAAAIKFVNYLMNNRNRAKIIGTTIGAPPTEHMRKYVRGHVSSAEKQFIDYITFEANAKKKPVIQGPPNIASFSDGKTQELENLGYGKVSVSDAADHVFDDLRNKLPANK